MTKFPIKLLDGIVESRVSYITNPYNGMDYLVVVFADAKFLVDFGPWKTGHRCYNLTFDPFHPGLTETNQDEVIVATCKVAVVAS